MYSRNKYFASWVKKQNKENVETQKPYSSKWNLSSKLLTNEQTSDHRQPRHHTTDTLCVDHMFTRATCSESQPAHDWDQRAQSWLTISLYYNTHIDRRVYAELRGLFSGQSSSVTLLTTSLSLRLGCARATQTWSRQKLNTENYGESCLAFWLACM